MCARLIISDCDTVIKNGGALATDQTTCNTACQGNANQTCGGGNRLSVFQFGIKASSSSSLSLSSLSSTITTNPASGTASSASSTSLTSSTQALSTLPVWTYVGCFNDSVEARTLANAIYESVNVMTNELCQSMSIKKQHLVKGAAFGDQRTGIGQAVVGRENRIPWGHVSPVKRVSILVVKSLLEQSYAYSKGLRYLEHARVYLPVLGNIKFLLELPTTPWLRSEQRELIRRTIVLWVCWSSLCSSRFYTRRRRIWETPHRLGGEER